MRNIGEFFSKIRGRHAEEVLLRITAQEAVKRAASADIPLEAISFKPKALVLKGLSQTAKSAVFVKRQTIIKDLGQAFPSRGVADIRFEG